LIDFIANIKDPYLRIKLERGRKKKDLELLQTVKDLKAFREEKKKISKLRNT